MPRPLAVSMDVPIGTERMAIGIDAYRHVPWGEIVPDVMPKRQDWRCQRTILQLRFARCVLVTIVAREMTMHRDVRACFG